MKTLFKYIVLLLICSFTMKVSAQNGTGMYDAINAGYLSSGSTFSDTRNNDSGYGYYNSVGQPSNDIWYAFTLTGSAVVNISHCGSGIDTYMHVLDMYGNEIDFNDDNGPLCTGTTASMQINLSPGIYYVVSEGYWNYTGNISTSISITGGAPPQNAPGSSLSLAINAGQYGDCQPGSFTDTKNNDSSNGYGNFMGQASNEIYYTFTLTGSTTMNISHCGSGIDTYVHLLNSIGTVIASNDDNGPLCAGTCASMQVSLSPGTYYVVSETYGYASANITTTISNVPSGTGSTGANLYNPIVIGTLGGTLTSYTDTRNNGTGNCYGNDIGQASDDIYYRFTLTANTQVTLSTCGSGFDTYLHLLNSSGAEIAYNDDDAGVHCSNYYYESYIQTTLPAGTYYAVTEGYSTNSGNITLNITTPGTSTGCAFLLAAPSSDQNYISVLVPRQGYSDPSGLASKTVCEVNQTIQYFDGFGRPLQTVQVKGNPDATRDVIQPMAYDAFGREATKYLPYTAAGTYGAYRPDALSGTSGYNNSAQFQFYQQTGQNYKQINTPSASTAFEPSPLNRITEQGAPGDPWQLTGTGNTSGVTAGHTNKIVYGLNDAGSLTTGTGYWARRYDIAIDATTGARTLLDNGSYTANQLFVTVSQDENWEASQSNPKLNTTETYTDKEGHVLLKRTFNYNSATSANESLSTYYVFDDFGQLCFVLPPKAEPDNGLSSAANPDIINNLCYQYRYDERMRPVAKRIPGADWQYLIYNTIDQVVATQDGNQRMNNQWIITKYDALGRMVVTGIWNSSMSAGDLKTQVEAQGSQWENKDNAQPYGYTLNNTYPAGLNTVLSVNYYDDYSFPVTNPYPYVQNAQITNMPASGSSMTTGLPTASQVAVLNTIGNANPDMLWTVNYYDDKGRVIQTNQQHYLGGTVNPANYDQVSSGYDFTNAVTQLIRKHYNTGSSSPALTIANNYVYDHLGRKKQSWEQINGGTNVLLSQNDYNEIGQALTKHLHSINSGASFFQDINYAYNERGWLTNSSAPLFAMQLKYNDGTTPQYNGNISNQNWGTPGSLTNSFTYSYDALNRLTSGIGNTGNKEDNISYDKMGNITHLDRYLGGTMIDNMAYNYTANGNYTNRLQSVNDASPDAGVKGYKSGNYGYGYDANGNMTTDNSKGLTVSYNLLNLPQNNTIPTGMITYTYDASGRKLRKASTVGTGATTEYINGIQYTNGAIDFVQTEEGRALYSSGNYNYEYNLADHLGNTRLSFDSHTGSVSTTQQTDYMPFGMEINVGSIVSPKNEYLYNKKELQEELQVYDYGWRQYDPILGRWTSVDPLAEQMPEFSPYNYAKDNPVNLIDPDGRKPTPNWVNFIVNINQLIANGLSGKSDPNRSCNMCCLNALASNLNSLYNTNSNIPVHDKFATAVTSLDADKYVSLPNAVPTFDSQTLSTRSQDNMTSKDLDANMDKLNSGITEALINNTKDNEISVFAVGIGMQYHSTMVIVSKNADEPVTLNGKQYSGSADNPLFIFVEDFGGARAYDKKNFELLMKDWVYSARMYYRHEGKKQDKKNPKKDNPLDTVIYQLQADDGSN